MATRDKELSIIIRTDHELAKRGLALVNDGLATLGDEAKNAQKALSGITEFRRLKEDTAQAETAWRDATAEVGRLAKELKATENPTKAQVREFDRAKKSAAGLKDEYEKNRDKLGELRKTLKDAGVSTTSLAADQAKLEKSLQEVRAEAEANARLDTARGVLDVKAPKQVKAELDKLQGAYRELQKGHKAGAVSAKELHQANVQLQRKTKELTSDTHGWTDSIRDARAGLAGLATVGYTVVKSFQQYSEFSTRMAEVSTLTEASTEDLKALGNEIIDLSTRIPQTATELAAAEYDIISAGVALADSTRVLEQSAKAAVAGVTDTKTAANVGIGVINAYGLEIDELGNVYDVLFNTVKNGVTTFPELAQSIGDTLPTAKAAGVSYQEVSAAIASLTKAGIRTPQATTALKGALNALAAPTAEAKKQFDALGITWNGLIPTLEQIAEKNLSIDQMRLLIPDVEARTGVLSLTQNMEGLRQSLAGMEEAGGSMEVAYDKMADTPEAQLKMLGNTLQSLGMELGQFAAQYIVPAAEGLRDLIKVIREAPAPVQNMIAALMTAGGAFTLWNMGLKSLATAARGTIVALAGSINGVAGAVKNVSGTRLPPILGSGGALNAALMARIGLYGSLALAIGATAKAYLDMRDAQNEAAAAEERANKSAARAQGIANAAAASTGLEIENIYELNRLLREGAVVRDELTGTYLTQEQAAQKLTRTQQREQDLARIRSETFATMRQDLGELNLETLNAAERQRILNEALQEAPAAADTTRSSIKALGDELFEATTAMRHLTEADAAYQASLDRKLEAQRAYVAAVAEAKREETRIAVQEIYATERALKDSLDRRLFEIQKMQDLGVVSQLDANRRRLQAQRDYLAEVVEMRQRELELARETYGAESDEFIQARRAMEAAELDLEKAAWAVTNALRESERAARDSGKAGEEAGEQATRGLRRWTDAAIDAKREMGDLQKATRSAGKEFSNWFYDRLDAVKTAVQEMQSLEELNAYQREYLGGVGNPGASSFDYAVRDYAREQYQQRLRELEAQARQVTYQPQQAAAPAQQTTSSRTMTLNFRAPDGQQVQGQFAEADAGRMLELLRQAGMVVS
jgi:TP901 family phage tail tape measure protein